MAEVKNKSSRKSRVVPIITAMCAVALVIANTNVSAAPLNGFGVTSSSCNITTFQKPPVIAFKREASAYISSSEWNIFDFWRN